MGRVTFHAPCHMHAILQLSHSPSPWPYPSPYLQTISAVTRASIFLLFNIALGSYILGTITLLVVKNDERTGEA